MIWNTNNEGGWTRYVDLTTDSKELEAISANAYQRNSDELMIRFSRRMDKIKFQSFGKVRKSVKSVVNDKELAKLSKMLLRTN